MTEDRRPEVLIIDDEQFIRLLYQTRFAHSGFDTRLAIDGVDALIELARHPTCLPDLIFLDLMLPRLSGVGFLAALKHGHRVSEVTKLTQLIQLFGFDGEQFRIDFSGAPVDAIRTLAATPAARKIPVAVFTARDLSPEDTARLIKLGACEVFEKTVLASADFDRVLAELGFEIAGPDLGSPSTG